ncbi:xanthine dehydrogenase family protein subunit M [Cupriavidus sp. 2TAF22]|uniref:FAD binding domain-containing protein n=1 Tax=unclassified Cupriavidus TaxID=2640874 RepID=UPI003F9390BF
MRAFAWVRATSVADALTAIAAGDAMCIAGGVELLNLMREGVCAPGTLVDLSGIAELGQIELTATDLVLGALTRMSDVAAHADVVRECPAIAMALEQSGSPQTRNAGTLGGNLLQRTRCVYFRNGAVDAACNKRTPGSGCAALAAGATRAFALFGRSSQCIATHPSDLAVALAALDAQVVLRGASGERTLAAADFLRLPGTTPQRDNNMKPGELLMRIVVPRSALARRSIYLKVRDRAAYQSALVCVAAAVALQNQKITQARIALGGVAHRPWRLTTVEAAIAGKRLDAAGFHDALSAAMLTLAPQSADATKRLIAIRAVERALRNAAAVP